MKPTETIDSVTTQILAQLSDMSLKEKELILQIVKNIIRLQMISDKPR